jgi:hypothetical protein
VVQRNDNGVTWRHQWQQWCAHDEYVYAPRTGPFLESVHNGFGLHAAAEMNYSNSGGGGGSGGGTLKTPEAG